MFKEIIICAIIIVAIFTGNFLTQDYTKEAVSDMTESLENLKEKLTKKNFTDEEIKQDAKNLNDKWKTKYEKLAYFIEHNELEKIETELIIAKSNIETMEYDYSINAIDKSIFILSHVEDKYAFNLENIF